MVFHVKKWAEVIGLQLLDLKIDPGSTKGWVPQKLPSSGSDFQVPAAVFRGVLRYTKRTATNFAAFKMLPNDYEPSSFGFHPEDMQVDAFGGPASLFHVVFSYT